MSTSKDSGTESAKEMSENQPAKEKTAGNAEDDEPLVSWIFCPCIIKTIGSTFHRYQFVYLLLEWCSTCYWYLFSVVEFLHSHILGIF